MVFYRGWLGVRRNELDAGIAFLGFGAPSEYKLLSSYSARLGLYS